jgi:hypothetical protein
MFWDGKADAVEFIKEKGSLAAGAAVVEGLGRPLLCVWVCRVCWVSAVSGASPNRAKRSADIMSFYEFFSWRTPQQAGLKT